jgi:hypothetical protein
MCSAPSPPQVVYQGPSKQDIREQERSLEKYKNQMKNQANRFQDQLREQIDYANAESEGLREQLEEGAAAAAAAVTQEQTSTYAATTAQAAAPIDAETTEAVMKKEKPASGLRISASALPAAIGTGLNIGV